MNTNLRTSPGPGSGSGISPTLSTSRACPCFSYQAAFLPSADPRLEGSEMPKNIMHSVKPRTGCAEAKRPGPLSRGFSHHFDS